MKNLSRNHRLNHVGTIETVHTISAHYSFLMLENLDIWLADSGEVDILQESEKLTED